MTAEFNSRTAGVAFLLYIVVAMAATIAFGRVVGSVGAGVNIAEIARHVGELRAAILLSLAGCFCAVALAVTLYAITRDVDRDLALMVLALRLGEGVLGAASLAVMLGLLSLATAGPGGNAIDAEMESKAGTLLLMSHASDGTVAIFFAAASTIFSYLLLRGRIVPVPLARIGVIASLILVVGLPFRIVGLVQGTAVMLLWIPMLVFELPLAVWLLWKGAASPGAIP